MASFNNYSYFDNVTYNSSELFLYDNNSRDYNLTSLVLSQFERIMSLLGLILNVSTIAILVSMKEPLKTQFKLILSLAVSDCLLDAFHFIQTFYFSL